MTAERMADTRRCPFCEQWIPMPARFAHKAFEAHKAACLAANKAVAQRQRDIRDARTPEWQADEAAFRATVKQGALL